MRFSDDELSRYARHIMLADVGGPGQQKLKAARVLVVGAGGLGSPVLLYLAASGVGTLGIVDHDRVALSNLQRQIIHTTRRVGTFKTASARESLQALNPHVTTVLHSERLTQANAMALIGSYDIVVDGTDNFATRYLVSDACFFARKPLVSAAVSQFDGQITTFKPYETAPDGNPWPTYRCLNPSAPPEGLVPNCAEVGILGVVPGIVGSLQTMEVLKEILGLGTSLAGRLIMVDALGPRLFEVALPWTPENPLNGANPSLFDLKHHAA